MTHRQWKFPWGSETDLGKILRSRGVPLRYTGNNAMSPLHLSDSSSPPGSERHGLCVAQTVSLCISPNRSRESLPRSISKVLPLADSTLLADTCSCTVFQCLCQTYLGRLIPLPSTAWKACPSWVWALLSHTGSPLLVCSFAQCFTMGFAEFFLCWV